jgi:CrcB protein
MTLLLVLAGGALGAVCRFLVDRFITIRRCGVMPWGTLAVNVAGSLLLGLLAGVGTGAAAGGSLPDWLGALAGTGFCGALTTYSTFSYETVQLATGGGSEPGRPALGPALLNVILTLGFGIGAATLGWSVAAAL